MVVNVILDNLNLKIRHGGHTIWAYIWICCSTCWKGYRVKPSFRSAQRLRQCTATSVRFSTYRSIMPSASTTAPLHQVLRRRSCLTSHVNRSSAAAL
ncbi:hypothetical protein BC827DRAFT_1200405 [Russula dissimulans]|nr:hypothetical protein BC827DRAFT_1200405 [Russula dissimulans]